MKNTISYEMNKNYFQNPSNLKNGIFPIAHIIYENSPEKIKKDFSRLMYQHSNSQLPAIFAYFYMTIFGEQPFQEDPLWYYDMIKPIIEYIDQGKLDQWLSANEVEVDTLGLIKKY